MKYRQRNGREKVGSCRKQKEECAERKKSRHDILPSVSQSCLTLVTNQAHYIFNLDRKFKQETFTQQYPVDHRILWITDNLSI